jgi:hypothetical protein
MKAFVSPIASPATHWKALYTAALFENDKSKIALKIAEAQQAIIARRRISLSGTDTKERQVLDTALLSLQALANCFAITPNRLAGVRAASVEVVQVQASEIQAGDVQAA